MAEERSGRERFAIGFMIVWTVLWTAGILIVLYGLANALLGGDLAAMAFMAVWLLAAGFGLAMGIRKLVQLLRGGRQPRPPARNHAWNDDTPA
jgi:hypothetical protein